MNREQSRAGWRRAGVLAGTLLLLAVIVMLIVRAPAGQRMLLRAVDRATRGHVHLEGPAGRWPAAGSIAQLTLRDAKGIWLVASNLVWNLQPRELASLSPRIRRVAVDQVEMLRRPVSRASRAPASFPALSVDQLSVAHAVVHTSVTAGVSVKGKIDAGLVMGRDGLFLDAQALEEDAGIKAEAALHFDPTAGRTELALQAFEPAGGPWGQHVHRGDRPTQAHLYLAQDGGRGWHGSAMGDVLADGKVRMALHQAEDGVWTVMAVGERVRYPLLGEPLQVKAARLDWSIAQRRGSFRVTADWKNEPCFLEGVAVRRPEELQLPKVLLHAAGLRARANLQRARDWKGSGRIHLDPGGALARWSGQRVDAEARISLVWTGSTVKAGGNIAWMRAGAGDVRGARLLATHSRDAATTFSLVATQWMQSGRRVLDDARLRGDFRVESAGWRLRLTDLSAARGRTALTLRDAFTVQQRGEMVTWSAARFTIGSGEVETSGALGPESQAAVRWKAIDLAEGWPNTNRTISGTWSGHMTLSGTLDKPKLGVTSEVNSLQFYEAPPGIHLMPTRLQLAGHLADGRANLRMEWAGWTPQPVEAALDIPMQWRMRPWRIEMPQNEPGQGSLRGEFDLARLERVIDLRGARIRGRLSGELSISGTRANPEIKGRLALPDASLDLPASGTSLSDIRLVVEGDQRRLTLRKATARVAERGELRMEGHALFDPERRFPLDLQLHIDRAPLWHVRGSRVTLDGSLAIRGDLTRVSVTGNLDAVDTVIQVAAPAPAIRQVPVMGAPPTIAAAARSGPPRLAQRADLDVRVRTRPTADVRGRGLESVWRANLRLGGTVAEPRIDGDVQVQRGSFMFLGRRFDLESAWLGLDGQVPPQPSLNLVAVSRSGDMIARLQASGSAREPKLELTSDPSYPMDEILARLMYGKSADSISAFQAVRLAYGMNVLRGRGSTLDVLSRGQSLLRVDQIDLRTDEDQGTLSSLAVGKYIGRRVFVLGETALDGSGETIAVDVDLAPSLTLQTETSPGIREGIGLRWRRDY